MVFRLWFVNGQTRLSLHIYVHNICHDVYDKYCDFLSLAICGCAYFYLSSNGSESTYCIHLYVRIEILLFNWV